MGLTKEQRINGAIELLEHNGYIVNKDYSMLIGKWVAFYQIGMWDILHGKVIGVIYGNKKEYFEVECKNGCHRFPSMDDTISFTDSKQECYMIKRSKKRNKNLEE